jgi:hypothetical protein
VLPSEGPQGQLINATTGQVLVEQRAASKKTIGMEESVELVAPPSLTPPPPIPKLDKP